MLLLYARGSVARDVAMTIRFDDFELDEERRQLFHCGTVVHLQPKAWTLLKLLLDRSPAAVSKTEIYDHLWPDTFVSDVNVATLIANLRDSLGDDAREPALIRTVHGFGYAFCGNITMRPQQRAGETLASLLIGARVVPLYEGETIIGRDATLAVVIDDSTVSRRHAIITCSPSQAAIEDCGSKNGTFVANRRLETRQELREGDVVTFGTVKTVFTRKQSAQSTQTVAFDSGNVPNP